MMMREDIIDQIITNSNSLLSLALNLLLSPMSSERLITVNLEIFTIRSDPEPLSLSFSVTAKLDGLLKYDPGLLQVCLPALF